MSHSSAGFTLVELLVSLALLSMTSLLVVEGVGSGRRVWERMDRAAAAGEAVEGAQTLLRARLERTFPATRYDASAPYVDFTGAADSVSFLAPPPESGRPAPLRRYRLSLNPNGDLILASRSDLAPDPLAPPSETLTLLHGVQQIELAYYGPAAPDHAPRWRPLWQDQPASPRLVRLRLSFAPGDHRWWPDLIVAPAADIDSGCILTAAGRCKGRA